jgi:hypothetical protein
MPLFFSCGDEMGLTLLNIVERQARANQIPAALYTAGQIADATDWTVAMEVIALGQLEGGVPTGALHTATRIPTAVNRNGP